MWTYVNALWACAVACAAVGWVVAAIEWRRADKRASSWRDVAYAARAEARGWRELAGRDPVHSKRTIVAPQYHAPRSG